MKPKKRGLTPRALRILWWCSFAVFVISALLIAFYFVQSAIHKRDMEELTAYVMATDSARLSSDTTHSATAEPALTAAPTPQPASSPTSSTRPSTAPSVLRTATPLPTATPLSPEDAALMERYRSLAAKNPDFIGWLTVANTQINDPVLYTPNDAQHYLHRDFKGAYSTAGQLFLDAACTPGEAPGNQIIYGHNMKDGSRFGNLKRYLDEAFFDEQPLIQFDTLHGRGQYQVMAAFVIRVEALEAPSMLCYRQINTADDATVAALCDYLDQYAEVRADGVDPQWGDELLTLSTCGRSGSNERVVVMARRVREAR